MSVAAFLDLLTVILKHPLTGVIAGHIVRIAGDAIRRHIDTRRSGKAADLTDEEIDMTNPTGRGSHGPGKSYRPPAYG